MKKLLAAIFAFDLLVFALSSRQTRRAQSGLRMRLLDLNAADRDSLVRLSGLGPFLADRIIENRPYRNKLELISRRVIPDPVFRRISNRLEVVVESDASVITPIAI